MEKFGADGVFYYFCASKQNTMKQKEAIIEALKRLGGKARMDSICNLAKSIGNFTGSQKPDNTIRNCIYMHPRDFRKSDKKGWWELVSYSEEISSRDCRIKELEKENARLREVKTEDDFVRQLLNATKNLFGINRKHADYVRQVLLKLGRDEEQEELLAWIQGKEKKVVNRVTKKYIQKNINSQVFTGNIKESQFNGGGTNNAG